jgi:hypothetical protein
MTYLFPRNVAGFSTIETLLVNNLQIQTQAVGGFSIYISDPTLPIFTVDGSTGTITTRGTLNVLGTASFQTVTLTETTSGLLELASQNSVEDKKDIGIFGEYNNGAGVKFTAIFRNTYDPLKRWFLAKDFLYDPDLKNDIIPPLLSTNYAGIVLNTVHSNNGSVGSPSYSFEQNRTSGMYLSNTDELSFSVGGILGLSIIKSGISDVNISLGPSTKFTGIKYNYQISNTNTLNLTADTTGHYYTLNANTVTITLPTGSSNSGREFIFTWKGTPGSITITCSGSDTIGDNSQTSYVYSYKTNTTFRIIYDGASNWLFM